MYVSLADQLCTSRDEFEKYEKDAKEMLPDIDYETDTTHKRIRQKVPNDGDTPVVYMHARDRFRITSLHTILTNLQLR